MEGSARRSEFDHKKFNGVHEMTMMLVQRNRQCEGDVAIAWRAMELVAERRRGRQANGGVETIMLQPHQTHYVRPQNIVPLSSS
jgi:hypothetical protein